MRIPARYAPILFAFVMSGFMALVVSCTLTLLNRGWADGFFLYWMHGYALAWPIAFPAAVLAAPVAKRIVAHVVE